jgi:CMP-N-acetylneuraminic acid synthetase
LLRGEPLISYTIRAAQAASLLTDWLVSTEDKEIADLTLSYGAQVIKRPDELAQDDTTTGAVLRHALDWMEDGKEPYDMIVCLHPTSPIRKPRHIDEAIKRLRESHLDVLASVCALPFKSHQNIGNIYGDWYAQDFEYRHERSYMLNASIYAMKRDWFVENNEHTDDCMVPLVMDRFHSLDIDEEIDLKIAELYLGNPS